MDACIQEIISDLIEVEGGYVDDPDDRGGETKYGITVAVARAYGYMGEMRDLPRVTAGEIYYQRYVTTPYFHRVIEIAPEIGRELVDTGVNMGPARAAEFLQRWLNGFNAPGSGYADLFVDGRLGEISLAALQTFLTRRGPEGVKVLLAALNSLQGSRYLGIAERDASQRKFLYGWVRARVAV